MFGKSSDSAGSRTQSSLIQEGVVIRGDIKADGDIRLDGTLEGSLVCKSRVTVGANGRLAADVEAAEVLVMGRVHGKISAVVRIELRKGAHVEGDLSTGAIVIEEGVFFQGGCRMSQDGRAIGGTGSPASARPQPAETGKPVAPLFPASGPLRSQETRTPTGIADRPPESATPSQAVVNQQDQ